MITDKPASHLHRRAAVLAAGVVLAAGLFCLPVGRVESLKTLALNLLRPGQTLAVGLRVHAQRATEQTRAHFHAADQVSSLRASVKRLEEKNRRLADKLAAATEKNGIEASENGNNQEDTTARLLDVRCVRALVLGHQARAFLARQAMLDVGCEDGVDVDAIVIDCGSDNGLCTDRLVLNRGRVWGKIVEVGRHVSVVRPATAPGFRDLVRLSHPKKGTDWDGSTPAGPQGILEGTGEPLARIRLIDVTEPVEPGDLVWTATGAGVLPRPLLYGRVLSAERRPGAAHWEIRVRPAVSSDRVRHAVVLQVQLNPTRVDDK